MILVAILTLYHLQLLVCRVVSMGRRNTQLKPNLR